MFASYLPGDSPLHRLPAGWKIALVCLVVVGLSLAIRQPWHVVPALGLSAAVYALGRIRPRAAWAQVRPVLPMLLVILLLQWLVADLGTAVRVVGGLLAAITVAGVVALTTRVADMLDTVTRAAGPLRHVGVDPERVGLGLILTVRAVPLLADRFRRVDQARRARGTGPSLRALVVPTVLGALATADQLGDALAARGVDD